MKKKKLIALLAISSLGALFGFAPNVNAEIYNNENLTRGIIFGKKGPEAYAGKTTNSPIYKVSKDIEGSVTKGNTSVMFNNKGSLVDGVCVADNSRKMVVRLMEDDTLNDDDEVKVYTWSFNGLDMTSVVISPYTASDLIDSSGDNQVELYLSQTLDYRAGDKTTSNGPMYYFDLYVD